MLRVLPTRLAELIDVILNGLLLLRHFPPAPSHREIDRADLRVAVLSAAASQSSARRRYNSLRSSIFPKLWSFHVVPILLAWHGTRDTTDHYRQGARALVAELCFRLI